MGVISKAWVILRTQGIKAFARKASSYLTNNTLTGRPPTSLREQFPQYEIGKWSYGWPNILFPNQGAVLKVGAFSSIAAGVKIFLGGEHAIDTVTTYPFNILWEKAKHLTDHPTTKGDVIIGNDVWIGREAVIMSGVTIGDGAVIGARSLVSKDVPPYSIFAGNPARFIRKRFDDAIIQRLLELKFWDWPDEEIEQMLPLLLGTDLQAFIAAAEKRGSLPVGKA
ncbi:MAG: CatB-related O-acetyltransferase [Dehalococcoidales bacterium]